MKVLAKTEEDIHKSQKICSQTNSQASTNTCSVNTNNADDSDGIGALISSKSRFAAVVSETIFAFMTKWGYSRTRATAHVLQHIRGEQDLPPDAKIFDYMKTYGIGFEDASRVLVVSSAIDKFRRDHNISCTRAVDELSSKLQTLSSVNLSLMPSCSNQISMSASESSTIYSISKTLMSSKVHESYHDSDSKKVELPKTTPIIKIRNSSTNSTNHQIDHSNSHTSSNNTSTSSHNKETNTSSISDVSFQSQCTPIAKHRGGELSSSTKKTKFSNKTRSITVVDHSTSTRIMKNMSPTNNSSGNAKRKRDRERTSQHMTLSGPGLDDTAPPTKKHRVPST